MTRILASPIAGALSAMILVAALVAATTNHFLDQGNLSNLALQVSIVAIVAIGSTIVILTGGIDLSPGSAIALMTMVFAILAKNLALPLPVAILAGAGARPRARRSSTACSPPICASPPSSRRSRRSPPSAASPSCSTTARRSSRCSPNIEPLFYGTACRHPAAALLRRRALRARLLVPALHRASAAPSMRSAATRMPRGSPASTCG